MHVIHAQAHAYEKTRINMHEHARVHANEHAQINMHARVAS